MLEFPQSVGTPEHPNKQKKDTVDPGIPGLVVPLFAWNKILYFGEQNE